MRAYVIRRLLLMIPNLLLVSILIFFTIRLIPGDLIDIMAAEMHGFAATDRARIEKSLGFDVSMPTQYGRWIGILPQEDGSFRGLFQGNLGNSLWRRTPVSDLIAKAWPVSFELFILGLIISLLIAFPVGIYSALRQDTWGDYAGRSFAILSISIPDFWLATLIIVLPSIWWGWMPPLFIIPFSKDPIDNLLMFLPPAIVMGMALSGTIMRLTRTMMLETLRQDYIRTAWSKGLKERVIVLRHSLKNALIPVVTLIGLRVGLLMGGAVVIEKIFNLPGLGRLLFDAVSLRDYSIVSALMLIFAAVFILANLMVDLTYGFLDPRIRYR
jgi:peptide/nickel transport system permease protein